MTTCLSWTVRDNLQKSDTEKVFRKQYHTMSNHELFTFANIFPHESTEERKKFIALRTF